jgi:hypothetical protein
MKCAGLTQHASIRMFMPGDVITDLSAGLDIGIANALIFRSWLRIFKQLLPPHASGKQARNRLLTLPRLDGDDPRRN